MKNTFPDAYYDRVSEVLTADSNLNTTISNPESFIVRHLGLLSQFLNLKNGRILLRDFNSGELSVRYSETDEDLPIHQRIGCDGVSEHDVSKTKLYVPITSNDAGIVASIAAMTARLKKDVEHLSVAITYQNVFLGVLMADCASQSKEDREAIERVLSSVAEMFGKILVENSLCEVPLSA